MNASCAWSRVTFGITLFVLGFAAACAPKIGDDCTKSTDCSQLGDRLCDSTQPGGYCTVFNCEPDSCPEDEAVCVAFDSDLDPACRSADDSRWARFQRTFCMAPCEDSSDCRDGYDCVAPAEEGAMIVDLEPVQPRVCLARGAAPSQPNMSEEIPGVCLPAEQSTPWTPYAPPSTTSGGGGESSNGGAGGSAQDTGGGSG